MTNNTNFIGWSGNPEVTKLDLTKLNLSGSTVRISNPIVEGPVTINKIPNDGPSRNRSTGPVNITGETQTLSSPTPFNLRSFSAPLGVDLPFTAGTVDYSFPAGEGYGNDGFDGAVYHIAVDSDGRYVIGGGFVNYYYNGGSYGNNRLIRLNTDGTIDESFNISYDWDCYGGGFNDTVYTLEIQPDGKILVGGAFTQFDRDGNCNYFNRIIRLNSDGSRDTTFNTGNGFNGDVYDIHVQPDGKILVGGDFTQYNDIDAYRIIRLNSNGSIDSSFLIGDGDVAFSGPDDCYVNVIELQSDGKILVGGYFITYGFSTQNYITRLNSDGTLDTTFQTGNGFDAEVMTIALQSDGKIIVGGYFYLFDNNDLFSGHIVRLSSNGTLDTLFGQGLDNQVHSLAIQSDGKILVGGYFNTYYFENGNSLGVDEIIRFYSDCSFDYSFSYNDILNSGVEYITILEDSDILIGGFFGNGDPTVYPLNYFGRLHNSISVYPYTYTVQACAQPLFDETVTYVVGSLTPLIIDGPTYSFQSIQNPSVTVCGYVTYEYPSNIIDYLMVNEYDNCQDAYVDNYKLVTVEDCLAPYYNQFLPVWVVDKKYEVGDILFIDLVLDGMGRIFNKFAAQITSINETWDVIFPIWEFIPSIKYAPYTSCDEAIDANGLYYNVASCIEEDEYVSLIHKSYYNTTGILVPTGNNPVKYINNYYQWGPYELISGGTPEIYSVVEFTDDSFNGEIICELGLTKMSPEGILNYGFLNSGFDGSFVYTTVEQPDGKILVGGDFNQYLEVNVNNFMRINADGSLDDTFNNVYCNLPIWSTKTPFSYTTSGSIYFDGTPLCNLSADTNVGVWELGNNNFTFEWFQYFTGDLTHSKPTAFDYQDRLIRVYFEGNSVILVVDGDEYGYTINPINDVWCHFAITRYYDGDDYIWRIFQDGIELGELLYEISFSQGSPLLIGNTDNPYDNRGFKGYITNFRVNNGNAIYTENFTVPTEPLDPNYTPGNTVLCLSVNNETDYILDNCDDEISTSVNSPEYFRGSGFDGIIRTIALQSDGKILIGGEFNNYNNELSNRIIRLNSDGSIDQGFTWGSEFDNTVNTIVVQKDGKIVVGGRFSHYYDFYCPQIVRLNSDGSPDPTFVMGDGFDGDEVFTLNLETIRNAPFVWSNNSPITYTENIIVGGRFTWYNGTTVRGIVKLTSTGEVLPDFGEGFNVDNGNTPRVNKIVQQPDGKLIIIGGGFGNNLINYNQTNIPENIVRLVKVNRTYIIDETFTTRDWDNDGGFSEAVFDLTLLPNGKIIVGGRFSSYGDNNTYYDSTSHLVRLNSDGTLDTTFTFQLSAIVYTTELLLSKLLIVGGRFSSPMDRMLELFIGEEYELHSFDTCDGLNSNIYLPTGTELEYIKANVNNRAAVCGIDNGLITTPQLNQGGGLGGSMYFNGVDDTMVQVDNSGGQFGFGGVFDLTIEWFQYWEGGFNSRPFSIGTYGIGNGNSIQVSFEGGGLLWVGGNTYSLGLNLNDLQNKWVHFAITRYFNGVDHLWNVYVNGIQVLADQIDNTDTSNTEPLIIGNQINNDGKFQGYLTNFRVNNQSAIYSGPTITVPTQPLTCDANVILLITSNDENNLDNDICGGQSSSSTGVTWSSESPFVNTLNFSLFTATNFTSYNTCDDCGQLLNTMLYVRTGVSEYVTTRTMTKTNIDNVLANGPIFTTGGVEAYEIINYYY